MHVIRSGWNVLVINIFSSPKQPVMSRQINSFTINHSSYVPRQSLWLDSTTHTYIDIVVVLFNSMSLYLSLFPSVNWPIFSLIFVLPDNSYEHFIGKQLFRSEFRVSATWGLSLSWVCLSTSTRTQTHRSPVEILSDACYNLTFSWV